MFAAPDPKITDGRYSLKRIILPRKRGHYFTFLTVIE
jgi:hypothetical protein